MAKRRLQPHGYDCGIFVAFINIWKEAATARWVHEAFLSSYTSSSLDQSTSTSFRFFIILLRGRHDDHRLPSNQWWCRWWWWWWGNLLTMRFGVKRNFNSPWRHGDNDDDDDHEIGWMGDDDEGQMMMVKSDWQDDDDDDDDYSDDHNDGDGSSAWVWQIFSKGQMKLVEALVSARQLWLSPRVLNSLGSEPSILLCILSPSSCSHLHLFMHLSSTRGTGKQIQSAWTGKGTATNMEEEGRAREGERRKGSGLAFIFLFVSEGTQCYSLGGWWPRDGIKSR